MPPGSVFAFLAEHRHAVPDLFIADLFSSSTGRPSPADLVGSVLVLKELFDLSDPQTADAVRFDIRWKVACGRSLTQVSFDPSTLVYWRRRIAASDRPDRVFDAVAQVVAETGMLRGRRKRCADSTVFDDAVATQDTVTQLVAAMRKVARLVPGAKSVIERVAQLDYSKPGKPDIDWDDADAKQNLVSDLVTDALAVLGELCGQDAPHREEAAADAVGLLALVAGQDVEPADGSEGTDGRWRIARRVAPDRVISTVDPQARHTRKSKSTRRDGFRGHVSTEPETGLITDAELTSAAGEEGSDPVVGQQMIARDRFHRPETETPQPDTGGDAAPADEHEADQSGGDEAVAEPPAAAAGDSGEIATAGTDSARRPPRPARRVRACGCTATRPTAPEPPAPPIGTPCAHGDQTQATAPGRARRIHPRRFHHRRAGRRGHLPGRAHPANEPETDGDLRQAVRRLPTAAAVQRRRRRPVDEHPPARAAAARGPRAGPHPAVQAGLSDSILRGADHCLGRHPTRAPHHIALPRRRQEPCLAAQPDRRDQPAHPRQRRPHPP